MLALTLPHVDTWNTWYDKYGNTPEGFAAHNRRVSDAAERAGRNPDEIERSACVLVVPNRTAAERRLNDDAPPVERDVATHLRELAEAGADEAIIVLSPINERTIRALGAELRE
jgi:alkanesulfonate monooxygenase SsuD/methylene tetrahydromethanopterin reductase-like flavin-dependent oxidoreductase (luciferase family)